MFLARRTSFITALIRSSNWPRYLVPATIIARSRTTIRRSRSSSGTLPSTIFWARPSTMAVLPTPASPSSTGLFLVRRQRIWMTRSISFSRPMTGSSLPLPGQLGQVAAEGVQGRRLGLVAFCVGAAFTFAASVHPVTEQVEHLLAHFLELQAQVHQDLGGHALLLAQQAEQQVFGPHVVVVEVAGFLDGVLDDLLGPRGLGQLAHRDHFRAGLDDLLDLDADLSQVDVQVLQDVRGDAAALP